MPPMTLSRRAALMLAIAAAGFSVRPVRAQAQGNLTLMAPAKAGGGWDQTARALQEVLVATGGATAVEVENVSGAGGTTGLTQFARRKGQHDTLMVGGLVMVGAVLINQAAVSLMEMTPIARLTGEYEVIVVPAASPYKTLADLTAAFKASPGTTVWAGGSAGGTDQILVGLIAKAIGADPAVISYIAYSGGGEALEALLDGKATAGVSGYGEFADSIASGELRALAVSSPKRLPGHDIPTLHEQGVAVDIANWRALFAPPGLPDARRSDWIAAIDKVTRSPQWQDLLKKHEWTDLYLSGPAFDIFMDEEVARIETTLRDIRLVE